MTGETTGPIIGAAGLFAFAGAVVAVKAGALDALLAAALPGAGVVAVLVLGALLVAGRAGSGRAASAHYHGVTRGHVIRHEAAHAAVAHGVGAGNIRSRLTSWGGYVRANVSHLTPAEYVAVMRAGEYATDSSGCDHDRANAARELAALPRRERAAISREADQLIRRHVNNAFGDKVARALERNGRFR